MFHTYTDYVSLKYIIIDSYSIVKVEINCIQYYREILVLMLDIEESFDSLIKLHLLM